MPLEMLLVAKSSMWSRQIRHSKFGDVCLSGVASGGKVGGPKAFNTHCLPLFGHLNCSSLHNKGPEEESCILLRSLASENLLQQC